MRAARESLEGTEVVRLTIVEADGHPRHVGECVGYWCPHCHAQDETLRQLVHEDGCRLEGEHGRAHYDGNAPDVPDRFGEAIDPEHPITIIRSSQTDDTLGVHNGEILAFECDYCGNADETVGEIVHDEDCPLVDEACDWGMTDLSEIGDPEELVADGGDRPE